MGIGKGWHFRLTVAFVLVGLCLVACTAQARPVIRPSLPGPATGGSLQTIFWVGAGGLHFACGIDHTGLSLSVPEEGPSLVHEAGIALEGCSAFGGETEFHECTVRDNVTKKAGFIATQNLNGRFVWLKEKPASKESGEEAGILFWPEAEGSSPTGKEPLVTIEATGAGCPISGAYAFKGTMVARVVSPAVGITASTMVIELPTKPITTYYEGESSPRTKGSSALKVGEQTGKVTSIEEFGLESEEQFGVFRE